MGEVRKRDDPRKYSAYMIRVRERIDNMLENLLWLAENYPEILRDDEFELSSEVERNRRARILLKATRLFEPDNIIVRILNETSKHDISLEKKRKI